MVLLGSPIAVKDPCRIVLLAPKVARLVILFPQHFGESMAGSAVLVDEASHPGDKESGENPAKQYLCPKKSVEEQRGHGVAGKTGLPLTSVPQRS